MRDERMGRRGMSNVEESVECRAGDNLYLGGL